jgi:hypothetical protein
VKISIPRTIPNAQGYPYPGNGPNSNVNSMQATYQNSNPNNLYPPNINNNNYPSNNLHIVEEQVNPYQTNTQNRWN